MKFKGWQKLSLIEWPNKICSVVFVGGCNFRCPWCYNQDLAWHPEKLPDIEEKEILEYLERNKNLLEGVMITGGEPFASLKIKNKKLKIKNELIDFIKKVKKIGLAVGVETNGSNPEAIEYLIKNELVDYIAMDIKGSFEQEKYNQLTGINAPVDKIKKSVKIIVEKAPDYEFRTTVVPGLLTEEDILEIAEKIKGAKRYYLQQFQQTRINADQDADQRGYATQINADQDADQRGYATQINADQDADQLKKIGEKIKNYFQIFEVRL